MIPWKQKIRLEIDGLIGTVKNIDELLYEMELKGYTVKRGKYISVKAEGQQRFVRLKTLGEDYSELSLVSRIRWKDTGANYALSSEFAPIRDDYIRTINDVTQLAREGKKIRRKRDSSAPYSPENDIDIYKLSAQLSIINRDNIHSIGELEGKISKLKDEYENTRRGLNELIVKTERLETLAEQTDIYLSLVDKPDPSAAEQLQLNICKQTLHNNNIKSHSDIDRLKSLQQETNKKIAALKNSLESCKQLYEVYTNIAKTYHDIVSEDYISKIIMQNPKFVKTYNHIKNIHPRI